MPTATATAPAPVPRRPQPAGPSSRPAYRRMAVAFVAVLALVELVARGAGAILPEPTVWYHDLAQVKAEQLEAIRGTSLDVVFAGTSQTYYGVDARLVDHRLGIRSYNAGVPAGVPPLQERWLLEEVLGRVDTNTVVWGLSLIDLNDSRNVGSITAYDEAFATRRGVLADLDRRLSRWSALFRHRRQLTDPAEWRRMWDRRDPMAHSRSLLRPDGVRIPGDRSPTEAQRRRVRNQVLAGYQVGGRMINNLRSTIETLRQRDIDVVLAWLPVPDRLLELLPDPTVEARSRHAVRALAADLEVRFVDVSDGFRNADFVDYTHLGPAGATRLSRQLADELRFLAPATARRVAAE